MIAVKGHKRYCEYRECVCEKCLLTQERRVIMAKQVALSRHQSEDLLAGRIAQATRVPLVKHPNKGNTFNCYKKFFLKVPVNFCFNYCNIR